MRDHLSWRTTYSCQKVPHFNIIEPATKDHLPWKTYFYGQRGSLSRQVLLYKFHCNEELRFHNPNVWFQQGTKVAISESPVVMHVHPVILPDRVHCSMVWGRASYTCMNNEICFERLLPWGTTCLEGPHTPGRKFHISMQVNLVLRNHVFAAKGSLSW